MNPLIPIAQILRGPSAKNNHRLGVTPLSRVMSTFSSNSRNKKHTQKRPSGLGAILKKELNSIRENKGGNRKKRRCTRKKR